jgi:hypothetical protein
MMFCSADQSPHTAHSATIAPIGKRRGVGAGSAVSAKEALAMVTRDWLVPTIGKKPRAANAA